MTQDLAYCADKVRLEDRDRYVAALYAPDHSRPQLLALYALYGELAAIPGLVSEPQLGEIRLRWWVETVERAFAGEVADHPILRQLMPAIERGNMDKALLLIMIEAQSDLLYGAPFATMAEFETHARHTETAFVVAASRLLAPEQPQALTEFAQAAGLAGAITLRLARFGSDRGVGKLLLPQDLCQKYGITAPEDLTTNPTARLDLLFANLAQRAGEALTFARNKMDSTFKPVLPALLHLSIFDLTLRALTKPGHDPVRHVVRVNPARRQWRIMTSAWRGRI